MSTEPQETSSLALTAVCWPVFDFLIDFSRRVTARMFADADSGRAAETSHSTALAAAELARDAEVTMLALTHVSPRYAGGELRDEARKVFENTIVPRDFDSVELPLPERGPPIHHREALTSDGQQFL